jgi:C_GCAxxG_C_C family probable redox protein
MNETNTLVELRQQGFFCSQIIILQGLEMLGRENEELVAAMHGLAGGLGFAGELCGALSGGAALLGLYAGKGTANQADDPRLQFMVQDLVVWFKETYEPQFGGIRCEEIIDGNMQNTNTRCPLLVSGVLQKAKSLLVENGYDLSGLSDE